MRTMLRIIAVSLLLTVPASVHANWGGSGGDGSFGSGNFEALGTTQVELVNEDLRIDLYKDHADVTVEYLFQNTGNDVAVRAGFPDILLGKRSQTEDYRIEVNGTQLPSKRVVGKEINIPVSDNVMMALEMEEAKLRISWLVSEVQFKQGEEKKVKISYRSPYQLSFGGVSDDTDYEAELFRYLLSTGATWKGPIQKATITITAASVDPDSIVLTPAGKFQRLNNTFTWQFENLEPTKNDNILIDFNNPVSIKMGTGTLGEFRNSFWMLEENKNRFYFAFHAYAVDPSSTLKPAKNYSATNINDMNRDTAWAEGTEGDGIGEYLLLKLKNPEEIAKVGIISGYVKSRETYLNNNRVAQLTVIINDSYKKTSTIPDEYLSYRPDHPKAYHFIDISDFKGAVKTIKLIIDKVYTGAKYQDTCISEVILLQQFKSKPYLHGAR